MNIPALQDYFEKVALLKQRFGVYDCCTFVVDALLIGWDRDFRDALGYWDRRTAVKRLRSAGGLRDAFTAALGPEHLIVDAPPGSVAYFNEDGFQSVGIIMNGYIAVKANRCIHRFVFEPQRTGWRTD